MALKLTPEAGQLQSLCSTNIWKIVWDNLKACLTCWARALEEVAGKSHSIVCYWLIWASYLRMRQEWKQSSRDQEPHRFGNPTTSAPHTKTEKSLQWPTISSLISQVNKVTPPSLKDHINSIPLPGLLFQVTSLREIERERERESKSCREEGPVWPAVKSQSLTRCALKSLLSFSQKQKWFFFCNPRPFIFYNIFDNGIWFFTCLRRHCVLSSCLRVTFFKSEPMSVQPLKLPQKYFEYRVMQFWYINKLPVPPSILCFVLFSVISNWSDPTTYFLRLQRPHFLKLHD